MLVFVVFMAFQIHLYNIFKHSEQGYNIELQTYKIKFLLVCFSAP